jgi:DNA replication protein DnaC
MAQPCPKCDDMGMLVITRRDGTRVAEPCECQHERRLLQLHRRLRIPERYRFCTLDNFAHSYPGADPSLWRAFNQTRGFIDRYPALTGNAGLLYVGSIGTGKTHLAVALLQALAHRGTYGLFCDHRELLKSINNSYNPRVLTTESEVLQPVFDAEVLVLDELGSAKKTEWVSDMVEHILNTRYNNNKTTILTTNYANLPPAALARARGARPAAPVENAKQPRPTPEPLPSDLSDFEKFLRGEAARKERGGMREEQRLQAMQAPDRTPAAESAAEGDRLIFAETLGDRIGERMRSRLSEMCVAVELRGDDYRQGPKRASFS